MRIKVTKRQARLFLLKKQLLLPPQSLSGLAGIETVFNTLRVIQYDPLNPCGRNPDLVLQSRILNIHPSDYHHWLYDQKKGSEVYDKELSIIPIEDFRYTGFRHTHASKNKNRTQFLKQYQKQLEEILTKIETKGPISSSDIDSNLKVMSGWGTNALFGRMALEALWKIGKLTIVKREGMKKYYDLSSKIHPINKPNPKLQSDHIIRRLNSVGLLPKVTNGGGWQGFKGGTANLITNLIKDNSLVEVEVENSKITYLILKNDLAQLENTKDPKSPPKMVFIAPLDNLIWDRLMIEDLFDFHYRWEVYTPKAKRKFGYYTLPILYGDKFIGRIEPIKKGPDLIIQGLWPEFPWDKKIYSDFAQAVKNFSTYLQTSNIISNFD